MKQIAITNLVCGTVVVLAPIVHNLITLAMVTHLLVLHPQGDYHLSGALSDAYQGWCLFVGICLLAVGSVFGWKSRHVSEGSPSTRLSPGMLTAQEGA